MKVKEFIKGADASKETSLEELLDGYVERANASVFFNQAMVLACWELITRKSKLCLYWHITEEGSGISPLKNNIGRYT